MNSFATLLLVLAMGDIPGSPSSGCLDFTIDAARIDRVVATGEGAREVHWDLVRACGDQDLIDFFELVAARNDDAEAQFGLWVKYGNSRALRWRMEACYWLFESSRLGHSRAMDVSARYSSFTACVGRSEGE